MPRTAPASVEGEGFLGPRRWLAPTCASLVPPSLSTECPHQEMDIVFLIDGSGSIDQSDFKQMKNFVRAVMGQFKGTSTLVKTGSPRPEGWGGRVCFWGPQPGRGRGIAGVAGSEGRCQDEARVQGQGKVPEQANLHPHPRRSTPPHCI